MKSIEVPDHLYAALKEVVDTFTAKGQDYSRSEDAWDSNFRFTSELFGIEPWDSAHFNIAQKLSRLSALRHRGRGPLNEPAIDSYRDIAVYAVIAHALILHHNAIAHPGEFASERVVVVSEPARYIGAGGGGLGGQGGTTAGSNAP